MSEAELSHLFLAIVLLLGAALGTGYLFERLAMPRVVGEIVGGMLLGPTVFGWLMPQWQAWIFAPGGATHALDALYWIGLVLLMFTSGFRIQRNLTREDRRSVLVVLAAATLPPFALGYAVPLVVDMTALMGPAGNSLAFRLVLGIAVAVTSIPVISRIFLDLSIIDTPFAKVVLACATLQDLLLWTILAVATGLAAGQGVAQAEAGALPVLKTAGVALVFLLVSIWLAPRILPAVSGNRFNLVSRASPIGYVLAVCFIFAAIASLLGINAIFGGFVAGIAVGALPEARFAAVKARIADISLGFFVPIYFALVGIKIDMPQFFDLWLTVYFILLSSAVELICVVLAACLLGKTVLTSFNLAVAMNTRGGPGSVLASVAYGFGIIGGELFVTLTLAALITSLASGVWFRHLLRRGWPLYE
jgi:Kef-type K+ transport system membrane component KefB